ncbi:MAG: hypothetical protein LE169_02950 [Endomicrobium sp.]|nr:hypothetical protein [Endomicrobium sp.]
MYAGGRNSSLIKSEYTLKLIEGFVVINPRNDNNVSTAKAAKLIFDLSKKERFVRAACTGKLRTENILNILKNLANLIIEGRADAKTRTRNEFTPKENQECHKYEQPFPLPHNSSKHLERGL